MRIRNTYKVRNVAGENLVVEQGKNHSDMTKIISLNPSALLLWNKLQGSDFTLKEVADSLVNSYGITRERAESDAQKWVDALSNCGIIE